MRALLLFLLAIILMFGHATAQVSSWPFDVKETDSAPSVHAGHSYGPLDSFYSALGIFFSGAGKSRPVEDVYKIGDAFRFGMISNRPLAGTSAGKPLVIRFLTPVTKFGFRPVRDPTFEMELRAYTDDNQLLGSVRSPARTDYWSMPGRFFGIQTPNRAGISSVILDFGEIEEPENIETCWWLPLLPRLYVRCLGQVGAGEIGGLRLETELQILTLLPQTSIITVELLDQAGSPMSLSLNGVESTSVMLTNREGKSSFRVRISNPGQPAKVGYARVTSRQPIAVNGIFRTFGTGGDLLQEAGIEAGPMRFSHRIPVERSIARSINTAIAVVSAQDEEQYVSTEVYDSRAGSYWFSGIARPFAKGEKRAIFLDEMFEGVPDEFEGTLVVTSQLGTSVTSIRTINGVAASSLPSASIEPD